MAIESYFLIEGIGEQSLNLELKIVYFLLSSEGLIARISGTSNIHGCTSLDTSAIWMKRFESILFCQKRLFREIRERSIRHSCSQFRASVSDECTKGNRVSRMEFQSNPSIHLSIHHNNIISTCCQPQVSSLLLLERYQNGSTNFD